jgi:hypothetical protein
MATNPFDQFDEQPIRTGGNPFDQFDNEPAPIQQAQIPKPNVTSIGLSDMAYQAAKNIPESAIRYGQTITEPFLHPVNTVNNLRDVIFGGLGKIIPGADVGNQQAKFDALRQMLAKRYGGYENIKQTVAQDPVGAMADVSSLLTGGGTLAAKLPGMVGRTAGAVAKAGQYIEPVSAIKKTTALASKVIPESTPLRLYKSALKPPTPTSKFGLKEQDDVLRAGLDAGIYPSEYGIDKLEGIIDGLNSEIMGKIQNGTAQGLSVSRDNILSRLNSTEDFFSQMPNPEPYLKAIDEVRQGMINSKPGMMPLDKVQGMKQTIYKVMKDSYGELSTATKEANKAVARGAKEEIRSIFPEIDGLNNQESLMLKLEPMIEKAAGRIERRDLMGIGTPIAGAAVSAITTPNVGKAAWVAKAVLDNPKAKVFLALALNNAKKGRVGVGWFDKRLEAYWVSKMNEAVSNANDYVNYP